MKKFFSALPSVIYFFTAMLFVIIMLPLAMIMFSNFMQVIIKSGFATRADSITIIIATLGLLIGISLLIPAFRKMYYKLPWLFAYVKIFYFNLIIVGIAFLILNYGYEVQDETRKRIFFIIMISAILIGRVLMSIYFNKKKALHIGGGRDE